MSSDFIHARSHPVDDQTSNRLASYQVTANLGASVADGSEKAAKMTMTAYFSGAFCTCLFIFSLLYVEKPYDIGSNKNLSQ